MRNIISVLRKWQRLYNDQPLNDNRVIRVNIHA